MGCTPEQETDCSSDEMPVHRVTLISFYIGKTEITQRQWLAVTGKNLSYFYDCGLDCPMETVDWNHIVNEFIPALNRKTGRIHRLPTEAEWEYAARGGATASSMTKYAGSNSLDVVGWYDDSSGDKTHLVAQKKPNGFGLYDMSGNVWEWCEDWHHYSYNGAPTDGSAWLSPTGSDRVCRGGSWYSVPGGCRSAARDFYPPRYRGNEVGFRLARTE